MSKLLDQISPSVFKLHKREYNVLYLTSKNSTRNTSGCWVFLPRAQTTRKVNVFFRVKIVANPSKKIFLFLENWCLTESNPLQMTCREFQFFESEANQNVQYCKIKVDRHTSNIDVIGSFTKVILHHLRSLELDSQTLYVFLLLCFSYHDNDV
jgi:hypothetical protein